ncbi:ImmA/IrrE family metallo-endopeptidase [Geitlerinema splendidum]|nr:ImmA/IrrE family metallo-endopeptidase [Geitlerinema splendidum]
MQLSHPQLRLRGLLLHWVFAFNMNLLRTSFQDFSCEIFIHQKAIIGINDRHPENRQRFTIAHELGHYLLHEQEKLHVDRRFQIQLRDGNSSKGEREEEKEANLFAAELLMPTSFIQQDLAGVEGLDLEDDAAIADLAKKYGVSTQAMTFRLAYLGYIQL